MIKHCFESICVTELSADSNVLLMSSSSIPFHLMDGEEIQCLLLWDERNPHVCCQQRLSGLGEQALQSVWKSLKGEVLQDNCSSLYEWGSTIFLYSFIC